MKVRGLSPKLPLKLDNVYGYALNKTHKEMIRQNLKMLILTIPGERIMEPRFGVGLKTFLFENNTTITHGEIEAKINEQTKIYMPHVDIVEMNFENAQTNPELDENFLYIRIQYYIKPLEETDVVELDFDFSKELVI